MSLARRLKMKGIGNYFMVGLMIMAFSFIAELLVVFLFILPAFGVLITGNIMLALILMGVGLIATIPALGYVVVKMGGD